MAPESNIRNVQSGNTDCTCEINSILSGRKDILRRNQRKTSETSKIKAGIFISDIPKQEETKLGLYTDDT